MLQSILELQGIKKLEKKEQKIIHGGQSFDCHCGFVGGSGESHAYVFSASSINDALDHMSGVCEGQGATCHGI